MTQTPKTPKKLFIKTYGCQMNVYDSERMVEALGGEGYVETKTADELVDERYEKFRRIGVFLEEAQAGA